MNKKVTAIVLASVLASPLMMAKISMASGGGNSLEFEKGFCITGGGIAGSPGVAASGGKSKCAATDTKGEAEVEYSQKTNTLGVTKTKLSAEVELNVPAGGTVPASADFDITPIVPPLVPGGLPTFLSPITCLFVNPPTTKQVFDKATGLTLISTKVEFNGSLSIPPSLTGDTLICSGDVSTPPLLKGSLVDVFVPADALPPVASGKLKND